MLLGAPSHSDTKLYQVPPRCVAYALNELFKKEKDYKNSRYWHH